MPEVLAENRYLRKRSAAFSAFRHRLRVPRKRKHPPTAPKTDLQAVFLKRVGEQLAVLGISRLALSKRVGGPPQKTLNDVMNGADPRLETVHQIATALGVPAWTLFVESVQAERKVLEFPTYPKVFSARETRKISRSASKK